MVFIDDEIEVSVQTIQCTSHIWTDKLKKLKINIILFDKNVIIKIYHIFIFYNIKTKSQFKIDENMLDFCKISNFGI